MESLSAKDIEWLSAVWNNALSRLGTDWGVHVTAIREPAGKYIDDAECFFDAPVARLIDMERQAVYGNEAHHFVSRYAATIYWRTPVDAEAAMGQSLVQRGSAVDHHESTAEEIFRDQLNKYRQTVSVLLNIIASQFKLRAMDADELLTHIHECLTGDPHKINAPRIPAYLDALIGHHDFIGGLEPSIEGTPFKVVTVLGYPNVSYPEMVEAIHSMPFPLRYTVRFLPLDQADAVKDMAKLRDKWFGSRQNLKSLVAEKFTGEGAGTLAADDTVVNLAYDAKQAIQEANTGAVKFGFFSLTVILRHGDSKVLAERVKAVRAFFDNAGFVAHVETTNTVEAFLGSIPGHVWENVRRPLMHSENFADFAPKTAIWAGHERCPSPLMKMADGRKAPPLLYAMTTGSTPFRLNLHVEDVGHSLIIGPTGAGKSTALALLAAQWQRYQHSRVISFDNTRTMYALTEACGGQHYDILGPDSSLAFAPLSKVDTQEDRLFAAEWLEGLAVLQGLTVTTVERSTILQAVDALAREKGRSMTDLVQAVQDNKLKEAFRYYSLQGPMGRLLDERQDGLDMSAKFITFELEQLLNGSDSKKITVPVLLYLFHRIEQMLDGSPTLILLDEAWVMLDNPLFLEKIREWLKLLRKKNTAVVFATQSLMDLKESPLLSVLSESCHTKIFLPNRAAGSKELRSLYTDLGLGDRQIEMLMHSTPKQDYYLFTPEGQRRIQFGMGAVTLAFCGVGDPREIARIKELKAQYGNGWTVAWLREKLPPHHHDWADLLESLL